MSVFPTLPHLRADAAPPGPHEARLGALPLTVLVGVTGVGKSTALAALGAGAGRALPDRREITDAVMILPVAGSPVGDREERFRLTAQYRAAHPGGMAQALGGLIADTRHWPSRLIFDGLRGLDEVSYAARTFARWRFVALGAPDAVRVRRLLGRADAFDRVREAGAPVAGDLRTELAALPGIGKILTPAELDDLAALPAAGHRAADVRAKVSIVLSERRHYDPAAAEAFLRALPPRRALVLDTVALSPAGVARAVEEWAAEGEA